MQLNDISPSKENLQKEARLIIVQSIFLWIGIISLCLESKFMLYISCVGAFIPSIFLSQKLVLSLMLEVPVFIIRIGFYWTVNWLFSLVNLSLPYTNSFSLEFILASYIFSGFTVDYLIARTGYLFELIDFKLKTC